MNLNELAKALTSKEGLKKQVNIAQMKEILRIILTDDDIGNEIEKRLLKR
jgi:hypothetical protein